jgi:X-Pro dipeptidyl-peptidase
MGSVRRSLAGAAALACSLAVITPVTATAQTPPSIVVENGLTQPVFSFSDAIVERVYVETPLDTEGNGELDLVRIDLMRPLETETEDFQVPVVLEVSPYRDGLWLGVPFHDVDPDELPQARFRHSADAAAAVGARRGSSLDASHLDPAGTDGAAMAAAAGPNLPGTLDDYYVPRGYGVIIAESVGTANSDGCPTVGDDAETQSAKAIIDWLNGDARGFDPDGNEVTADWSTGDVGMIGSSYNGTIPNQVATTGVEGLRTIVPVVAISDWYDYFRQNGLVVAPGGWQGEDADILGKIIAGQERSEGPCADYFDWMTEAQDRISGDYNEFWDERNYLDRVGDIDASVFVVHGRNDWNVKPNHYGYWWEQLARHDVDRKIWLHGGGHSTPGNNARYTLPDGSSWTYQQTVHRWFDHELWNVDNGIKDEPRAIIQRENGTNTLYEDFPVPGATDTRLRLGASDATSPGTLGLRAPTGRQSAQSFVDDGRNRTSTNLQANPDQHDENRLVYLTDTLTQDVHLSGTASVRLRVSVDNASAANLSAYLVDYGPPGSTSASMVTRGWMDPQNRQGRDRTTPIRQGTAYDLEFDLHVDDHVFQAGRRIGLMVISTDQAFTLRPDPGTQLTVNPRQSSIQLPIVGGAGALR